MVCLEGRDRVAVVVEDDDSVRGMIRDLLESVGFRVLACRDGFEGLKAAREARPAVVTLDLQMPGMDGAEVLRHLTSDEATSGLPVVIVSACASNGRMPSSCQVKAIVSKPFDVDELCDKVCTAAGVTAA